MVNLPPDPNDSRRRDRILDFDELLAVVLALLGIGSILWWGLSRSSRFLPVTDLLQRRPNDGSVIEGLAPEDQTAAFEPSRIERGERPQPARREGSTEMPGAAADGQTRAVVPRESPGVIPAAPNTTPSTAAPAEGTDTTQPLDISDVPETHWAYPFIQPMYEAGYLPDLPQGRFQPDQALTRAELAALISRAFGSTPGKSSARRFSDIPSTYWAAPAIDNAVALGFMDGYPEGDFRPEQTVPRYEVLVALSTGLELAPPASPDLTLKVFVDLDALPTWARPKVAAATEDALVVNYPVPDQLNPDKAATRAEIVAMIHQALVDQGKLPAVKSEYVVP